MQIIFFSTWKLKWISIPKVNKYFRYYYLHLSLSVLNIIKIKYTSQILRIEVIKNLYFICNKDKLNRLIIHKFRF